MTSYAVDTLARVEATGLSRREAVAFLARVTREDALMAEERARKVRALLAAVRRAGYAGPRTVRALAVLTATPMTKVAARLAAAGITVGAA